MPSSKILSPERVRELMAAMQPKPEPAQVIEPGKKKVHYACEMIQKSGASLRSASQSWGVGVKKILTYARENGIPISVSPVRLDERAKALVESGEYKKGIPHGLKQRVAYELALRVGVSRACRELQVSRRGIIGNGAFREGGVSHHCAAPAGTLSAYVAPGFVTARECGRR